MQSIYPMLKSKLISRTWDQYTSYADYGTVGGGMIKARKKD